MASTTHPWHATCRQSGRRFTFGLLTALSLTLVAFEWRSGDAPLKYEPWDPGDDGGAVAILPPVVIEKTLVPQQQKKVKRGGGPIVAGDPDPIAPDPLVDEPGTGEAEPGPEPVEPVDPGPVEPSGTSSPAHWNFVSIRPHFVDCMKRGMKYVDECTEERIGKHLERRFRVPPGIRGPVRTTITFEIDAQGRIGRLVCTPRVAPSIEAEIERVIRSLPEFVPGSQGGHAVPVYYQIPLSVRTASS